MALSPLVLRVSRVGLREAGAAVEDVETAVLVRGQLDPVASGSVIIHVGDEVVRRVLRALSARSVQLPQVEPWLRVCCPERRRIATFGDAVVHHRDPRL